MTLARLLARLDHAVQQGAHLAGSTTSFSAKDRTSNPTSPARAATAEAIAGPSSSASGEQLIQRAGRDGLAASHLHGQVKNIIRRLATVARRRGSATR